MVKGFHGSRSRAILVLFIFAFSVPFLTSRISAGETEGPFLIDQALEAIAIKRRDLSIRTDIFESPHTLNIFKRWIEDPLKAPLEAQEKARRLITNGNDPFLWLKTLAELADMDSTEPLPLKHYGDYKIPLPLPEDLRQAIILLMDAIYTAQIKLASIIERIGPERMDFVERYLFSDFHEWSLKKKGAFTGSFKKKELKEAILFLEDLDRKGILQAGLTVARAIKEAVDLIKGKEKLYRSISSFSFQTGLGRVVIGGTGQDVHDGDAILIIDLGGDDIYMGRVAAGMNGGCSIVIDLHGNDIYLGEDSTQGSGLRGIGVLYDLKGDDLYRARNLSQGAGLFGLGLLIDGGGSDIYLGGKIVQAASSFGWGGLIDISGEDLYQCRSSGQAFSGIGGVSSLCDLEGNDKYISGTSSPDPREPDMNQSLSQGFSKGIPHFGAGGFAILVDGEGNDIYQCQYFGQGSSYWMGVGCLYDDSGKDVYLARRYAQGAGIHFAIGILLDAGGDDYTVSWGASQGFGHDHGMGMLINETGDDKYVSDWLSMGASDSEGVGIFVDNSGEDGYEVMRGMGVCPFSDERRPGGLGVFIDARGRDRYSNKGKNNTIWGSNRWEVGIDGHGRNKSGISILTSLKKKVLSDEAEKKKETERMRLMEFLSGADGLPEPDRTEALLFVASHWGLEKEIPKEAKEKLKIEPWRSIPVLVDLLGSADTLSINVMDEVFRYGSRYALPELIKKAEDRDPLVRSRVFHFLGRIPDQKALKTCLDALKDSSWRVRTSAINAIGEILVKKKVDKIEISKEIPQRIMEFLEDRSPDVRKAAAYTLSRIGYSGAIPRIIGLLEDTHRDVRDLASMALLLFEDEAIGPIEEAMKKATPSLRIVCIDILSRIKGERARLIVERYLDDPDGRIRRAAKGYRD